MRGLLARMDRRKNAMLSDAGAWGAEALVFRPDAASWCALDVLDHLAKTEHQIALSMRKNSNAPRPITVRDHFGSLMVYAVMYAPSRIKAPPGAETVLPQTPASLEEAAQAWGDARQLVVETARSLNQQQVRGGVFRHPVGGWMSAVGTLRFLESHLAHHRFQWKRLRAQALPRA